MFPPSYLSAKLTVDDRALNRRVKERFWQEMGALAADRPLAILELGAGNGAMISRFLADERLPAAIYTALDSDPQHVVALQQRLGDWSRQRPEVTIDPLLGSFEGLVDRAAGRQWDVIVAHAFLDLFHLPTLLPRLFGLLRPGGLLYATLNFNGRTLFEPVIDRELDELIERLYHQSMDEMLPAGRRSGSRSGGQLLHEIPAAGGRTITADGSDWVVFPQNGAYPAAEGAFLHHILNFFDHSLTGHPDLDPTIVDEWLRTRRRQIERGQLVFSAHHLDVLAQKRI